MLNVCARLFYARVCGMCYYCFGTPQNSFNGCVMLNVCARPFRWGCVECYDCYCESSKTASMAVLW
jgi:hypothetical protein